MHPAVQTRHDSRRGCGWRKTGGMYMVSGGKPVGCGKLPVSLERLNRCPHCGESLPPGYGLRVSRAARMIEEPTWLWRDIKCKRIGASLLEPLQLPSTCMLIGCPLRTGYEMGPALLIWVGEKFYKTPDDFMKEAASQGISRRITSVPDGFEVGKSYVLLAHSKACERRELVYEKDGEQLLIPEMVTVYEPGIFTVYKPSAIEIVVDGTEEDEVIDGYMKRGLTPVIVERKEEETE